jgi:putative spermidine/putrescine transport system ATP-binding protein
MTIGLEVDHISKSFGTQIAVDDVSLSVPRGQFVCFLGPSGCGKTTLLRMIAGLEAPSSGHVLMNGKDITKTPVHRRNFAMVFQGLALFPFLTVAENIAYSLKLRSMTPKARRERVTELLQLIRLPDIASRRIDQLSGGQRQRVAIARALAQEPALFLLDEPLSALDAELREHMQVELRMLQQKLQVTTILVTHDQREAMTIADTIVVMADGVVQQIGLPTEIYRKPANRFVAGFIGRSNLLDAELADRRHIRLFGRVFDIGTAPSGLEVGRNVTLSIRPEHVRVLANDVSMPNTLSGRITFMRDVGDTIELRIDCEGREIIAAASDWSGLDTTKPVAIQLPSSACNLLTH